MKKLCNKILFFVLAVFASFAMYDKCPDCCQIGYLPAQGWQDCICKNSLILPGCMYCCTTMRVTLPAFFVYISNRYNIPLDVVTQYVHEYIVTQHELNNVIQREGRLDIWGLRGTRRNYEEVTCWCYSTVFAIAACVFLVRDLSFDCNRLCNRTNTIKKPDARPVQNNSLQQKIKGFLAAGSTPEQIIAVLSAAETPNSAKKME